MDAADLRAIVEHLQERITVAADGDGRVTVCFPTAAEADLVAAGLHPDGVRRLLAETWWQEMVEEVVTTPEFCDPGDPPGQVLAYARDVVFEYVAKRFRP